MDLITLFSTPKERSKCEILFKCSYLKQKKLMYTCLICWQGKDPSKIWMQVEEAIREVCLAKEHFLVKLLSAYPSKRNFFEMMRFDFVVDEDLNVFIMEVIFYIVNTVLAEQIVDFAQKLWV